MLQLTSPAAAVLREARAERGVPEHFGLRVQSARSEEKERGGVRLDFAESPSEGDEVGETEGMRVFVAPELAEPLADQTLDAQETAGGQKLFLREQTGDTWLP
jgi:Fe-S cluster assembly iron-binding protein IscA